MNKNINLSQLKDKINGNVVITIVLVVLAAVLAYTCYYTFQEGIQLQDSIYANVQDYNNNKTLLKNLKNLQANSEYYLAQKEKYDEVIAENGTYNTVDYYVELTELCEAYELTIQEISVGDMAPNGNVNEATTTITVTGSELNVKRMAEHIVSQKEIARIDNIAMTQQDDGTVITAMTIVNFTK